ncbi:YdcH family protein [Pararhodobacter zhoushanensis]|uniref:YdcH family protein n=1 Tax=Pararhodobacter zhoushanensis TaxID=2479545 RepID=UPI000F8DA94F|nr:YdcH family protein [Pararhodobacter zhoushanensis]
MSHTPHELAEEFPGDVEKMHALKAEDAHFAKLFDDYHAVNKTIHRAETKVEPMAEEHEEALRKQRLALKDEIAAMLRTAK